MSLPEPRGLLKVSPLGPLGPYALYRPPTGVPTTAAPQSQGGSEAQPPREVSEGGL